MRQEVFMPRLGQSMEEGRVANWVKPIGTPVERGEVIAEIETDKATVDLESLVTGTLIEIVVPEGEIVPTGTTIAIIDDGEPAMEDVEEPQSTDEPQASTDDERVKVSPAARRLAEEHGVDLRAVQPSNPDRFISKLDVEAYLVRIQTASKEVDILPRRINISPVARQIAERHGIDLLKINGTGPSGRIVRADVEAWIEAQQPQVKGSGEVEGITHIPLSKLKQLTARRMSESKATVPHFYASTEIEMSRTLALRDSLKSKNVDISINDLILRATTLALLKFPHLNARFAGEELHGYPNINLAVAVAVEGGLITPVIHRCESLTLAELAAATRKIVERARSGHLRPEDLEDGTFTVSNLGMFGVTHFQAIVNPPQAAILAVGEMRRVPIFDHLDRVIPAQLISVSVSADHRITDGAEVARFLQEVKRLLEDTFELL